MRHVKELRSIASRHPSQPVRLVFAALLLAALIPGSPWSRAAAQEAPEPPPKAPKVEHARVVSRDDAAVEKTGAGPKIPDPSQARVVEERPGHHAVREVRLVKAGGGRVEGARQEDWIAFDMVGGDERYDVYVMRLGTGVETCLTCDLPELRKVNALNPSWHPSGDYLVIQVQSQPKKRGMNAARLASPHRALGSELWVITRDGRDAWQITRLGERGAAVLDPHFSHEAGLLVWSERLTSREAPWGEWGLRLVDFEVKRRVPRLGKTRTFRSGIGHGLVTAHGFTPDDRSLLVSAIPDRGLGASDILRLDLETERVERLTSSPDQSDELVSSVPYSDYLVWATDRGLDDPRRLGRRSPLQRASEVWLRSSSGMAQERLTYFNHPRSDHYLGRAYVGDLSWTADGESLLLHVVSADDASTEVEVEEGIYLVKLGKEYRR